MTTEITRKQAILLGVLGVLLVVVLFVQLLIRPTLSTISETKEQIETLNDQYQTLLQQSESYDQNIASLQGWEEKNEVETERLFPLCDTDRIDRFLTFVMNECGVGVNSLSIGGVVEYYIDGEGNLITADPNSVDTSASDSEEGGSSYTATGEYRCDFTYSMEGNYEDMLQMLNFVNRVQFLGISSFSFNSIEAPATAEELENGTEEEDDNQVDDWYSFTMTITAYMYKSPLQTEQVEEEDTEEAETETAEEESQA
jgi:hypothetical protein